MHVHRSGSAAFHTLAIAAISLALSAGCNKPDEPSALTYSANPAVYTRGLAIAANAPTWSGGSPDSFSVSPALPAGLAIDRSSGVISGTPSAVSSATTYTVTAKNDGGSTRASLSIAVDARLAVLFTTDEHSHVFGAAPELDDFPLPTTAGSGSVKGGVARRATVFANERAAGAVRGVETITVSAGDFSQGTLAAVLFTQTNPDLSIARVLGYDAIAIGNHEFELGLNALVAAIGAAPPAPPAPIPPLPAAAAPLVLTNVAFDATSTADDGIEALYGELGSGKAITRARIVTTAGGLKVGVVAALGRGAASSSALAAPLSFTSGVDPLDPALAGQALDAIAAQLQPVITSLRDVEAVDAVVLLGHGGIGATAAVSGDDERLAAKLRGVDLVVSGHSHETPDLVRYVADLDARQVPIMQPAPYGSEVGRAELVIHAAERPTLDTTATRTRFIAVDDRILPSQDPTLLYVMATVVGGLESVNLPVVGMSFLELNLSTVTGGLVADDPAILGDLYHYVIGKTAYDVVGIGSGETNGSDLDTDAMLAAANAVATTQIALQNRGAIRGDLVVGATGDLGFADVYRMVPNGGDPVESSPGYPLIRGYLLAGEIFGALDTTAKKAVEDGDFFIVPSGLKYEYDSSRPLAPLGSWIKKIDLVDGTGTVTTPIYDETVTATGGWLVDPFTTLVSLVTTLYVGEFAKFANVTLRDQSGVPIADLNTAILTRGDGSHVKDYQALASYIVDECAANTAAPGFLPDRYGAAVPRRALCTGPLCQQ